MFRIFFVFTRLHHFFLLRLLLKRDHLMDEMTTDDSAAQLLGKRVIETISRGDHVTEMMLDRDQRKRAMPQTWSLEFLELISEFKWDKL